MKKLTLMILLSFFTFSSFGRMATRDDFNYINHKQEIEYRIKKDGTYRVSNKVQYKIQNEQGVKEFSLYSFTYNKQIGNYKLIKASVINNDKEEIVAANKIENKLVASTSPSGFDNYNQIKIAFPNVKIGSVVYIETIEEHNNILVPEHFSDSFSFGAGEFEEDTTLKYISEIPLNIHTNDPYDVVKKEVSKKEGRFVYTFKNKRHFSNDLVGEIGYLKDENLIKVELSSDKKWDKISKYLLSRYPQNYKSEFEVLAPIIEKAKKLVSLEEKVDYFTEYLSGKINYVGDWRSKEGSYFPRAMDEILKTNYGDCKDYSHALVYLLQNIGLDAKFALVNRSRSADLRTNKMMYPTTKAFNHAIVYLKHEDKEYWIDPTNNTSYGLKLRSDISGQYSLILGEKESDLKKVQSDIPTLPYKKITRKIELQKDDSVKISGKLEMKNELALAFSGMQGKLTTEKFENVLKYFVSSGDNPTHVDYGTYDFKRKKYKDVDLDFKYKVLKYGKIFNRKKYLSISGNNALLRFYVPNDKTIGDLIIGSKGMFEFNDIITNVIGLESRPKSCTVESKWVDVKKDVSIESGQIRINRKINIKENLVSLKEAKGGDYKTTSNEISNCLDDDEIFYKVGSSDHEFKSDIMEQFKDIRKADLAKARFSLALKIYQSRGSKRDHDYSMSDAKKLLEANIEEFPAQARSYIYLAATYSALGYYGGDYRKDSFEKKGESIRELLYSRLPNDYYAKQLKINDLINDKKIKEAKLQFRSIDLNTIPQEPHSFFLMATIDKALNANEIKNEYKEKLLASNSSYYKRRYYQELISNLSVKTMKAAKKCVELYEKVHKLTPNFAWGFSNSLYCYQKARLFKKGIAKAKNALEIMDYGMAYEVLKKAYNGYALYLMKKKRFVEAKKMFQKSIEARKSWNAYFNLAKIAHKNKKMKEVEKNISYADSLVKGKYNKQVLYREALKMFENDQNQYYKFSLKALDLVGQGKGYMYYIVNAIYHYRTKGWSGKQIEAFYKRGIRGAKVFTKDYMQTARAHVDLGTLELAMYSYTNSFKHFDKAEVYFKEATYLDPKNRLGKQGLHFVKSYSLSIGRKPASLSWKLKKHIHKLMIKYLEKPLYSWKPTH